MQYGMITLPLGLRMERRLDGWCPILVDEQGRVFAVIQWWAPQSVSATHNVSSTRSANTKPVANALRQLMPPSTKAA